MAKLPRKNQEIFAENAADVGVFGSAQLGTKVTSKDLDTLQSLAAFKEGWKDAALGGKRRPTIEEFNALNYINTTQIAQIQETGIPEYLAEEKYYIGSIIKEVGNTRLYGSITDENTGNPLTDITNWQFLGDLSGLRSVASNTIVINAESDFPAPIAGVITLESGKEYLMNNVVVTANRFELPAGGFVRISANNLSHALVYVGGGVMFSGLNFGLFITFAALFQAPSGTFYDLDGVGSFFPLSSIWQNCATIGTIKLNACSPFFNQYAGFTNGITFSDRTDLVKRASVGISHTTFSGGANAVTDILTFSGDITLIAIQDSGLTTAGANETILNLDQSLAVSNTEIIVQSIFNTKLGGNVFAPDSLREDYVNAKFFGCTEIDDSTTSIQIGFEGNAEATTINTIGVPEPINTRWQHQLPERLVFQDYITFNSGPNTITTRLANGATYNHGLVDGDRFKFKAGITPAGTLPAEFNEETNYYVISAATTTFQVSLTLGGSAITFATSGTGENYFRHLAGVNASSWIVYIGLETTKLAFNGATSFITQSGATDRTVFMSMKKFDTNFVATNELDLFGRGELTVVNNSLVGNSPIHGLVKLGTGESIKILATNNDSTTGLVATNSNISILKV